MCPSYLVAVGFASMRDIRGFAFHLSQDVKVVELPFSMAGGHGRPFGFCRREAACVSPY